MEQTVKHHPTVKRESAPKPTKVAPELSMRETGELSPEIAAWITRPETRVPGLTACATRSDEGSWVTLFAAADGRCVGACRVARAEKSSFAAISHLSDGQLSRSVVIEQAFVEPGYAGLDVLGTLLYFALRRARLWDRPSVVAYLDDAKAPIAELLDLRPLERLPVVLAAGASLVPVYQRLDIAMHRACRAAGAQGLPILRAYFVDEAVETLEGLVDKLFATPWFRGIYDGTLSREQYVCSLSNFHTFVRFTTRLLARAVALSDEPDLRAHFINHLSGEINHEVIIEKDLQGLGVDVDYVVNAMVPNVPTQEFMVVQESMIGFYQDPILFMAAPFAAEGFAARLDQRFIDCMAGCASKWGIAKPKQVIAFLASHVHFDGGDDGHWALTRDILEHHIQDDVRLQRFLNAVRLAMNGFIRCYTSYAETVAISSATPMS